MLYNVGMKSKPIKDVGTVMGMSWESFRVSMAACVRASHFVPLKMMTKQERERRFSYDPDARPTGEELDKHPEL